MTDDREAQIDDLTADELNDLLLTYPDAAVVSLPDGRRLVRLRGVGTEVRIEPEYGLARTIVVPTDTMPDASEADVIEAARQAYADLEEAGKGITREMVENVADAIAEHFRIMVDMAADDVRDALRVAVADEGTPDDERQAIAEQATKDAHRIAHRTLQLVFLGWANVDGVDGEDAAALAERARRLRDEFTRNVLTQAWAWTIADARDVADEIEREAPGVVITEQAFYELAAQLWQEGTYVARAMLTLSPPVVATMTQIATDALQSADELLERLVERARESLRAAAAAATPAPRPLPMMPAFAGGVGDVPNDRITRGWVMAAQAAADNRGWLHGTNEYPYFPIARDGWGVQYILQPEDFASADAAWAMVAQLDDAHAVTAMQAFAHWLANYQHDPMTQLARISPTDLLAYSGTPKHHKGGYRREDKLAAAKRFNDLGNVWVKGRGFEMTETDEKGRKRRVNATPEGRFFVISSRIRQETLTGEGLITEFIYRPGDWAYTFMRDGRGAKEIARMMQAALAFDPKAGRYPLRLGMYLTWIFRVRAARQEWRQPHVISTLLEEANLMPREGMKDPLRVRRFVEKALDDLRHAGVIGSWAYLDGDGKEIPEPANLPKRGWLDLWLQARLLILPPDTLQAHYQSIAGRRVAALPKPKRARSTA